MFFIKIIKIEFVLMVARNKLGGNKKEIFESTENKKGVLDYELMMVNGFFN